MSKNGPADGAKAKLTAALVDRRNFVTTLAAGAAAAGLARQAAAAEPDAGRAPAAESATHAGAIWWNEYLTQDFDRASFFYANVVGWKMKLVSLEEPSRLAQPGESGYMVMLTGADESAGVMRITDAEFKGARAGWFTYLQVANVDDAVVRAVRMGGGVIREPVDSEEGMRIAVIQDPEGCIVGLASTRKA